LFLFASALFSPSLPEIFLIPPHIVCPMMSSCFCYQRGLCFFPGVSSRSPQHAQACLLRRLVNFRILIEPPFTPLLLRGEYFVGGTGPDLTDHPLRDWRQGVPSSFFKLPGVLCLLLVVIPEIASSFLFSPAFPFPPSDSFQPVGGVDHLLRLSRPSSFGVSTEGVFDLVCCFCGFLILLH